MKARNYALQPEPTQARIHHAIERVYRAGMGECDWAEALAAIAAAHGADRVLLFTPGCAQEDGGLAFSHDRSAAHGGLRAVPETPAAAKLPEESYSTMLLEGDEPGIPATLFVLFRGRAASPLASEERLEIEAMCRHLALAVRLWFRKRLSMQGAEILAASISAVAVIVDEESRIAWANARAEHWVSRGRLAVSNGRLADVPGFSVELPRLVREVAERRVEPKTMVAEGTTLQVVPVGMPGTRAAALVILRDGAPCRAVAAALADNYRLTSTEVDLAIALWKGVLIGEYASQRNVAMSTVRTQLKSLLAKTGARRQSDVVSIVARLQPIAMPPGAMAEPYYPGRDK